MAGMVTSVQLENFRSFGVAQDIPLAPITVLVGPNNSGKSSFISFAEFVRAGVQTDLRQLSAETLDALLHRPVKSQVIKVGWKAGVGSYSTRIERQRGGLASLSEELLSGDAPAFSFRPAAAVVTATYEFHYSQERVVAEGRPFTALAHLLARSRGGIPLPGLAGYEEIWSPVVSARIARLSTGALRRDTPFSASPEMAEDGSGLAGVLSLWRGAEPEKSALLDDFLSRCLPEVKSALVKPAPSGNAHRFWIQQKDGERFDATRVSDGVLCFTALAMMAIEAKPGSLLFIEEPEVSIHPRRLHELVDLLRTIQAERQCQFVIATHSPLLVNEFQDEPEAILTFKRTPEGTVVESLAQRPDLSKALERAEPGMLMADGFFS